MSYYIGPKNNFVKLQEELMKENNEVNEITNLLKAPSELKQQYENSVNTVRKSADYDISNAFSNYKRNQLELMRNKQLSEGFKETLDNRIKNTYNINRNQIESKVGDVVTKAYQSYIGGLDSVNKRLNEWNTNMQRIEDALYDFGGIDRTKLEYNINDPDSLNFYKNNGKDEFGRPIYELTDIGRNKFQELLYGADKIGANSFGTYLKNNVDERLLDFYLNNQNSINELIAGLPSEQRGYDKTLSDKAIDNKSKFAIEQAQNRIKDVVDVATDVKYKNEALKGYTDSRGNYIEINNYNPLGERFIYDPQRLYSMNPAMTQAIKDYNEFKNKYRNIKKGDIINHNGRKYMYVDKDTWFNVK